VLCAVLSHVSNFGDNFLFMNQYVWLELVHYFSQGNLEVLSMKRSISVWSIEMVSSLILTTNRSGRMTQAWVRSRNKVFVCSDVQDVNYCPSWSGEWRFMLSHAFAARSQFWVHAFYHTWRLEWQA
jgi:hypothetical protein